MGETPEDQFLVFKDDVRFACGHAGIVTSRLDPALVELGLNVDQERATAVSEASASQCFACQPEED